MRLSPRPRRYVSPATITLCGPLLTHDTWRDAYLLRGVGPRFGPVLRRDRRRAEAGYDGPERRTGLATAAGLLTRLGLVRVLAVAALVVAPFALALALSGHSSHLANAAPRPVNAANVSHRVVTTHAATPTHARTQRQIALRFHHHLQSRARPVRAGRAAHPHRHARRAASATARRHTTAAGSTVTPVATPTVTTTDAAPVAATPTPTPTVATPPTPTVAPAPTPTPTATAPTSTGSTGSGSTGTTQSGGSGTVSGGGSGTVHGGG